ncbi:MAG: TonB-dependent receptor [Rhodospirillaceae bacterium]
MRSAVRRVLILTILMTLSLPVFAEQLTQAQKEVTVSIPRQNAEEGLKLLARAFSRSVLFQTEDVAEVQTNAIEGDFSLNRALSIMLEGTQLTGGLTESGVITISRALNVELRQPGEPMPKTDLLKNERNRPSLASRLLASAAAVFSAFTVTQPSDAAAQQVALEEIIVTARKTEERLQDTPLTVTAFTGSDLENAGISDLRDLQKFTPGLNFFSNIDRGFGQVLFRGMNNAVPVGDTTREIGSMFIDGVYYVGTPNFIGFDDLERVEVVKGPQSAFFGRATFGGAINFVTRTPGEELRGKVRVKGAEDDDYEVSASLEGAVVPGKLTARISGSFRDFGGQYRNALDGEKLGAEEDTNISGTLYATPTDNLTIKARALYQKNDDGPAASQLLGRLPNHNCGPFGGTNRGGPATLQCGIIKYTGDRNSLELNNVTTGDAATQFGQDFGIGRDFFFSSLAVDYDFSNGWIVSSLSGYTDEDQQTLFDFERTGDDVYGAKTLRLQESYSQEFRLASPVENRLRGLVGLYYLWQNNETAGNFYTGVDNPFGAFGTPAGTIFPSLPNVKTIDNRAVFGAISYDVSDEVTVSLEGRYQRDKVTSKLQGAPDLAASTKKFLPRLIVDYKPSEDITLYANIAKGNKPTQVNQEIADQPEAKQQILADQFQAFDVAPEETIWNYEIGAKTTFAGGRGLFNIAAYYADWKDKQSVNSVQFDSNGNGIIDQGATGDDREQFNAVVLPAGNVNLMGVEIETSYAATQNLTVGGTLAYNDNNITELDEDLHFRYFGTLDASDKEEPRVSIWSATANATYTAALTNELDWFVRADGLYSSSRWASILNLGETGDEVKFNFKAGVENEKYNVTFFVDNAFNDKTLSSLRAQGDSASDPFLFLLAAYEASLPRLRQFGVTASINF